MVGLVRLAGVIVLVWLGWRGWAGAVRLVAGAVGLFAVIPGGASS